MNVAYRCDHCGGFTDPHVREAVEDGQAVDLHRNTSKSRDCRRKVCMVNRRSRKDRKQRRAA